jgi:cysteine-rich repeat protein
MKLLQGLICCVAISVFFFMSQDIGLLHAQTHHATTTLFISICGDLIVNQGEQCDVASPSGQYSTTIAGRQCTTQCLWAPYCGDGILQTRYGEQCDDGNNTSGDFCSATCKTENADTGGGSTGGGGSSATGGQSTPLGSTQVHISGEAYPNSTVNILLDGTSIGTVLANSSAAFVFTTDVDPGATSMGFWANDSNGTRSTTYTTTFDVTQGAVTNVNDVLIPPTIKANDTTVNPGDTITLSGQTVPNVDVEVDIDDGDIVLTAHSDSNGNWSVPFDTSQVSVDTHTAKARFIEGSSALKTESTFGTAISLFVGVQGAPVSNSDLNRDGKVDLTDFSILVYWWGSPGGNSDPPADINQNGNVGLEDFSILLFNWTG